MYKYTRVPNPHPDPYVFGSASGSDSQRYESEDPDPYKNVRDPQYWYLLYLVSVLLCFESGFIME
jgi:hypothetical protein